MYEVCYELFSFNRHGLVGLYLVKKLGMNQKFSEIVKKNDTATTHKFSKARSIRLKRQRLYRYAL